MPRIVTCIGSLALLGCQTFIYPPPVVSEYRGVMWLRTETAEQARAFCGSAGLDLARVEGRSFAEGGSRSPLGVRSGGFGESPVRGCYIRGADAIVCADDVRCLEHEHAHAREGLIHQ